MTHAAMIARFDGPDARERAHDCRTQVHILTPFHAENDCRMEQVPSAGIVYTCDVASNTSVSPTPLTNDTFSDDLTINHLMNAKNTHVLQFFATNVIILTVSVVCIVTIWVLGLYRRRYEYDAFTYTIPYQITVQQLIHSLPVSPSYIKRSPYMDDDTNDNSNVDDEKNEKHECDTMMEYNTPHSFVNVPEL